MHESETSGLVSQQHEKTANRTNYGRHVHDGAAEITHGRGS